MREEAVGVGLRNELHFVRPLLGSFSISARGLFAARRGMESVLGVIVMA
jgi:hypothetical protein